MNGIAAEQAGEAAEPPSKSTAPPADDGERANRAGAKQHQASKANKRAKSPRGRADNVHGNTAETPHQRRDGEGEASASEPSLGQRLLAKVKLAGVALHREFVPPELLAALDGAGLGSREVLPPAALSSLAAICACVGPNVRFDPGLAVGSTTKDRLSDATGMSLRVVMMAPDRKVSWVAPALLAAAYAAENDAFNLWRAASDREAEHRHTTAHRRRLHQQAVTTATLLGIAPPAPLPEELPGKTTARPRLVLRNAASSAILKAAAAGAGLLVIDDRAMPSMCGIGNNFDEATDQLVNTLSLGCEIGVEDPVTGQTAMRSLPACVFGVLTEPEWPSLYRATSQQLKATVFVAAAKPPITSDASALSALLRKACTISDTPINLRLSDKAQGVLASAADTWTTLSSSSLPPLAAYYAESSDLARRIAMAFHLAVAAAGDKKLNLEIAPGTVKRAVALVNGFAIPMARQALGPLSTPQVERDARRIVAYLREHTSEANRIFDRRRLVTAWQRSMTVGALDAAIQLLCQENLLVTLDKTDGGKGGQRFEVALSVYAGV